MTRRPGCCLLDTDCEAGALPPVSCNPSHIPSRRFARPGSRRSLRPIAPGPATAMHTACLLRRSVAWRHDRRRVRLGTGGCFTTFRHRHPGNTDVAIEKGLAGHAIAGLELLFGQMLALLGFDGVGVLETLLYPAFAGAAQPAAAFERNATLLPQRYPKQIAVLGCVGDLAVVGQECDLNHVMTGSTIQLAGQRHFAQFGVHVTQTRQT